MTNPQNPHGEPPKSPSYCLTDIPIQASAQKDPNWNYEISAYIRIPGISAPNKKNSTYPPQAGAIELVLNMRTIFSFRYHKDTAFRNHLQSLVIDSVIVS